MTKPRKFAIAAVLLLIGIALCWPRSKGYTYQGRTVEEWFEEFNAAYRPEPSVLVPEKLWAIRSAVAFHEMGTNAAPFLASRIIEIEPSPFEKWRWQMPTPFHPKPHRVSEASHAAMLLAHCMECPAGMLRELLKPALVGTNYGAKLEATYATNSALAARPQADTLPTRLP